MNYYNERDPRMAAWLRALIAEQLLPQGVVDERSIEDVLPSELAGYAQCHFFAGIGGWPEALRLAGWPSDRLVWTGSCPCQSFSAAGKGKGFADERHLWPAWFYLIQQCQPAIVFGEQVDAAIKHGWLDLVQADMEALGYSFGAAIVPAAGVGAPHGRHRVWFVADSDGERSTGQHPLLRPEKDGWNPKGALPEATWGGATGGIEGLEGRETMRCGRNERAARAASVAGATAGYWSAADWIPCTDGKWRPVEPGVEPLAHGVPARMDKLRGFGNAIVPQVAAEFIMASIG